MSKPFDADAFFARMAKIAPDQEIATQDHKFLSTGFLPLNHAISGRYRDGGLPQGRIIEIFGPESSGKTAISSEVMVSTQKAGGVPMFHDHERSFDLNLSEKRGLNVDKTRFYLRRPRTFEDSLMQCTDNAKALRDAGLPMDRPITCVFDSLASMIPQSQIEKGKTMTKLGMADQTALARSTSLNFKTLAMWAEELNICMIFLNQIRQKPGVIYGDPNTTPGGNAPKYYASVRIQLGASRIMKKIKEGASTEEESVMIGSEITARCIKNKIYRPWMRAKWRFMFRDDGTGHFDSVGSTIDTMLTKGLITKNGVYIPFEGKNWHRDPLIAALEKDPTAFQRLEEMMINAGVGADFDEEAAKAASVAEISEALVEET